MNKQDKTYEYRTGRTQPEKSRRGWIAVLLICVIFLGGLISALSFMNIHLFQALKGGKEEPPLSFTQGEGSLTGENALVWEGMVLQEADPVYEQLHALPEGLYVAQVEQGSQAQTLGVKPGDVLIYLGEKAVSTRAEFQEALNASKNVKYLSVTLFREDQHFSLIFTVQQ